MWYPIKSFIAFLFKSTNQHGVHSPFVYQLVTQCFYNKETFTAYKVLNNYRQSLLRNNTLLEIEDFGSGSRVFKSQFRTVASIAKTAGSSVKKTQLLYRLSRYLNCKNLLELGTALGQGTQALCMGAQNGNVTSIEGSKALYNTTKKNLTGCNNLNLINGIFKNELSKLNDHKWDLIFIDGHHDKAATIAYFEALIPNTHNDSLIILDDIYWSKGMNEAWNEIIQDESVAFSIDLFRMGILFFDHSIMPKQHFKLIQYKYKPWAIGLFG